MDPTLLERAAVAGRLLRDRGETISVSESASGGLINAALLAVPGASAYMVGGAVVYTMVVRREFLADALPMPPKMRGATEEFAQWQAQAVRLRLDTTWGLSETGAAGPTGNPYGDPSGHGWAGLAGPNLSTTRIIATGSEDRVANMTAFAINAIDLLVDHPLVDQPA